VNLNFGSPKIDIGVCDGYYLNTVIWTELINDGNLHHVVFSVDSDKKVETYVDGKPYSTYTDKKVPGNLCNDVKTGIGIDCCGCPSTIYKGDAIDEVKLFNGALTADEVVGLYNADLLASTQPCQN
jgi:hypothetical protein